MMLESEAKNAQKARADLNGLYLKLKVAEDTVQQLQNTLNNSNSEISRLKQLIDDLNFELQNQKDKNEMLRNENDELDQKVIFRKIALTNRWMNVS